MIINWIINIVLAIGFSLTMLLIPVAGILGLIVVILGIVFLATKDVAKKASYKKWLIKLGIIELILVIAIPFSGTLMWGLYAIRAATL